MFRSVVLPILVATSAFAQNTTFVTDLVQALKNTPQLDKLVEFIGNISNTTVGQALLADLPNGNKTIFAPVDHAFNGKPPKNITDKDMLAAIFSYHIVSGTFEASDFATAPNHTLVRTFLSSPLLTNLEANRSQVLELSNINDTITILGQNTHVQIVNSTKFQNIPIHLVNAVIDPPAVLADVLGSRNLSLLVTAANQSGALNALTAAHGITIFAPSNQAFTTALQALGGAANVNQTVLSNVLLNHVINGTTIYAAELGSANWTSAGGQPFTFVANSSGTWVSSGNSTAKVIESDLLTSNGVVHLIDQVLVNAQNDPNAADSAFQSATSSASANPAPTAIGPTGSGGSTNGSGGGGNGSGSGGNGTNGSGNNNAAVSFDMPFKALATAFFLSVIGAYITL